jgi:hypothetical protein
LRKSQIEFYRLIQRRVCRLPDTIFLIKKIFCVYLWNTQLNTSKILSCCMSRANLRNTDEFLSAVNEH